MKKLVLSAVLAASAAAFGARMIECSSATKVLSPVVITGVAAASPNASGTLYVTNRFDLSYSTNSLATVVVTNGWTVGVGQAKTPVVNTNTVVRHFPVERHLDVPVCTLTLSGGFASTNGLRVLAAPGNRIIVTGADARTFVYGD